MLTELKKFQKEDHFAIAKWRSVGHSPPPRDVNEYLRYIVNTCTANLIQAAEQESNPAKLKKILNNSLKSLRAAEYTTAQQEYIYEVFLRLSYITGVSFRHQLNTWLHGTFMSFFMAIMPVQNPPFPA